MNFLSSLVEKGVLTAKAKAEVEAEVAANQTLEQALASRGISLSENLAQVAASYGMPSRILGDPPASEEVLQYIQADSARHYGFVPLAEVDGVLEVGIIDPDNIEAIDALQFISGKIGLPYKTVLITKQDFDRVIAAYQNLSGEVGKALSEYETTSSAEAAGGEGEGEGIGSLDSDTGGTTKEDMEAVVKEEAPVTKIVTTILRYAIEGHSSDVHIEPTPSKTRVRFRMDGVLHTSLELPARVHEAVVARIKILSKLRLDEKRKPQDGRFTQIVDKRRIDFRVSTFPTEFGEKVVMRILDQSNSKTTLESIFQGDDLATVKNMMDVPYGIILIAGPTGSGKSTTLFAMLSEFDRESNNVVSLEDPVEYQIPGVSQSQMRPEIGYTFASGLRSVLRQDPDVIMVGEIRDKETAVLAVQAALTGHLVLSTIHTNTAAGAIPRLVDMGVDPYLIAPTLVAVIGQRLVRRLCEDGGGSPFPISDSLKEFLDRDFADLPAAVRNKLPPFTQFYHAAPTATCPDGTRGRMSVFEILRMNKDIEQVLLSNPVEEKVYEAARANGMLTMKENAILRALGGQIPFEDINTLGGELLPGQDDDEAPA